MKLQFSEKGIYSPNMGGHMYRGSKITMEYAEAMMRGDRPLLWRKLEDITRNLIWC